MKKYNYNENHLKTRHTDLNSYIRKKLKSVQFNN